MPPLDADAELMLRVKDGDDAAFELLMTRHRTRVINTVYRFLGSTDEAEDLAQEVFLSLYRSAARYEPRAKFTTFLYRLVANRCINHSRRRKILQFFGFGHGRLSNTTEPTDRRASPAETAEQRQTAGQVNRAIQALPERQRLAIILRHYHGMDYSEIAATLNMTMPSVKSVLHRATLALRDKLRNLLA